MARAVPQAPVASQGVVVTTGEADETVTSWGGTFAVGSVGTVTAAEGVASTGIAVEVRKRKRRPVQRVELVHTPPVLYQRAKVRVRGVKARGRVGGVEAHGRAAVVVEPMRGASRTGDTVARGHAHAMATRSRAHGAMRSPEASGLHNPTEDELLAVLLAA